MKHIWTVLCQKSSIDFENNLLSLFNTVEELSIVIDKSKAPSKIIVLPVEIQMISYWVKDLKSKETSFDIRGEFIDPTGAILNSFENSLSIDKTAKRLRNRTNIPNLPISVEGRYTFKLMKKDGKEKSFRTVAELPLDINISYKLLDN